MSERLYENVIIVGSGPAGYTAALYTARADLDPLVVEGFAWGGLLQQTTDVENYPGFPGGIMGPDLMQHFRDQAERFGARLETDDVTGLQLSSDGAPHKVFIGDQVHLTRTVILAMGAQHRKLDVDISGAFIAVGHDPQSQLVQGQVQTDDGGYVVTQGRSTLTNVPGVFAAGDLVDHTYRQAITAAGTGCQAALDAEWYLRDIPLPAGEPDSAAAAAS